MTGPTRSRLRAAGCPLRASIISPLARSWTTATTGRATP